MLPDLTACHLYLISNQSNRYDELMLCLSMGLSGCSKHLNIQTHTHQIHICTVNKVHRAQITKYHLHTKLFHD